MEMEGLHLPCAGEHEATSKREVVSHIGMLCFGNAEPISYRRFVFDLFVFISFQGNVIQKWGLSNTVDLIPSEIIWFVK